MVSLEHAREAILIERDDVPEVTLPDGFTLQLLHVNLSNNLWIVRSRFHPGFCIDTHYHTGTVYAFTESGELRWQGLVTGKVGIDGVPDAFDHLLQPNIHIKVIIEPWRFGALQAG